MKEFLLSAPTQAVIWTTVLVILVIVGWYVAGRFRDRTEENRLLAQRFADEFPRTAPARVTSTTRNSEL